MRISSHETKGFSRELRLFFKLCWTVISMKNDWKRIFAFEQ